VSMNRVPDEELILVPGGTLITTTRKRGARAITMARHSVHNIQPDPDVLAGGRPNYGTSPDSITFAAQVIATEFAPIAPASNYWRS
jgi:Hexameric tyrosine-coordinated heme protein (HTHP)